MIVRWARPTLSVGLFAASMIMLTTASASAFTRENVSPDGGTYSFDDPDNKTTKSDNGSSSQGTRPFGSSGPVVQFGVQQGSGFGQSNRYTTPDPYFQPLRSGN